MKVVFLGSCDFSLIVLKALLASSHQVVCVVTNVDAKRNRGQQLCFNSVKKFALSKDIPVLQFKNISKEGFSSIKSFSPDVLVTASFGQILRQNILELAPFGVVNVHASLLPKYRGSCPINRVLMQGETITGITIMQTALGIDSGDLISQETLEILPEETAGELTLRLATLGGKLLVSTLSSIKDNTATFTAQKEQEATYFPLLSKEETKLNFSKTAVQITNLVRGLSPCPAAFTTIFGKILKVFKATPISSFPDLNLTDFNEGEVVKSTGKTGLIVRCKDGFVRLDIVQLECGKKMPSTCFLNGCKIPVGTKL